MKSIYVGNISFETTPDQLRELFARHGDVVSVKLINDRYTGKPRGFAFVEMDDESAESAISATDGVEFEGRSLKVNLAKSGECGDRDSKRRAASAAKPWYRAFIPGRYAVRRGGMPGYFRRFHRQDAVGRCGLPRPRAG
jgi:RNA recognition motif-containing protein